MMLIKDIKHSFRTNYANLPEHWLQGWLLHIIDQPASFLITDSDYQLTTEQLIKWSQGVKQMQSGMPLAYLLGKQAFWSLEFIVNEHTLIPRPDTEVLVEQVLTWVENNCVDCPAQADITKELLDLGTGTGCIAISLAHELGKQSDRIGQWTVTGVDVSAEAIKVAKKNALLNQVDNIEFVQSNWFDALSYNNLSYNKKFSIIVSNPPYIDNHDQHLAQLIAEPITALVADNQGLADIYKIVRQAPEYLSNNGLLAIEHGYDQAQAVQQVFMEHGFLEVTTIKDYGGNDRITLGRMG